MYFLLFIMIAINLTLYLIWRYAKNYKNKSDELSFIKRYIFTFSEIISSFSSEETAEMNLTI
jgi:hypothetical protein